MKKIYCVCTIVLLITIQLVEAQTAPFSGSWSFEGNDNGTSSNPLVSVSSVSYAGVNKFGPNPYTAGYSNLSVNVQNWSTTLCNQTEYVQFAVQPLGTATVTLTTLSFAFSRSTNGPQQISVRSSVDAFSSDLFSQATATTYQAASIGLNSSFANQSNQITFRIYACNPTSGGGTLHLDEIQINGQSLPVTLVSFTAKPISNAVQVSWSTTSEQNADYFDVQRSHDLGEFTTVGRIAAKGTTDQRQYYGLTDSHPLDGPNYYRLKQVDVDGQIAYSKTISVVLDGQMPSLELLGNPGNGQAIHVAVRNLANATYQLFTITGRELPLRVDFQADGSLLLLPTQPLQPGLYLLRANDGTKHFMQKVLVE